MGKAARFDLGVVWAFMGVLSIYVVAAHSASRNYRVAGKR